MVTRIYRELERNIFLQLGGLACSAWMDNDPVRTFLLNRPMKLRLFPICLLFTTLLAAAGVQAQGQWRDLPPDERRQMRQQMREHWQQQRDVRREESGGGWREVPPEDRRRLREDMREQRGWQSPEHEFRERPHREGRGGWRRQD